MKIITNYIYNLSYQILVMILPIITTPYISRVLKADGVGEFNYSYAIVSVAIIVAQLGTNMYGQREIAFVQSDRKKRSDVFWNIIIIRIITSMIVIPIYLMLTISLTSHSQILFGMIIFLIANIVDVSWFFQGLEDFKKTALRNIAVKLLGVILIFSFVKNEGDVILYSIILACSQLIGSLLLWFYLPKFIDWIDLTRIELKKHIIPVWELFLPTSAVYIYTYIDKIILGLLSNGEQVGFYSQPEKIIKLLMTVITSLGMVMLPHIASALKKNDKSTIKKELLMSVNFVVCVGLPMVVGTVIISHRFIPWFLGNGYENSIIVFQILAPLIFIIGLASVVGQAILIPLKKQKIYTLSILAGALANLIINFALIPKFEAVGAAIGTLVAEITVTSIQFLEVKRIVGFSMKSILISNQSYGLATLISGIVGIILDKILPLTAVNLFFLVIVCTIVYATMLIIVKDKMILNLVNTIINKGEKI